MKNTKMCIQIFITINLIEISHNSLLKAPFFYNQLLVFVCFLFPIAGVLAIFFNNCL